MVKPLSKEFLLNRGFCCNNGCKNCPYKINEMIKLKDILCEGMSKGDILKIVNRIYPDIIKNLGRARKGTPKIEVHNNVYARYSGIDDYPGGENEHAEFVHEDNTIYLYKAALNSEEDVIRAMLHEYTHATQDPKKIKQGREKGYTNNPMEKQARNAEKNWKKYL